MKKLSIILAGVLGATVYDGHFVVSANRIFMVGGLNDPPGWDHMDNAAATVKPAAGTVELDVDEIKNTGKFEAKVKTPEGDLVLAIDRFNEFSPCQNGGIVAFRHEHGTDSCCGDNNWPKTFVFLARVGIRARDAEWPASVPGLRDALHDHPGDPGPEDPQGQLSDG